MRTISRVTTKGQITIPKVVRTALDLRDGDLVSFEVDGQVASLRRIEARGVAPGREAPPTALTEWGSAADEEAYRDL